MNRRKLITGLISFVAAPAIVRATSIMPVKVMHPTLADWSRMLRHPNSELFEYMEETNALLRDMMLVDGEHLTIRTSIPYATWRMLNTKAS